MVYVIKVKNKADKIQTLGHISCQNFEFSAIKKKHGVQWLSGGVLNLRLKG